MPFILPMDTTTYDILNNTLIHIPSPLASTVVYNSDCLLSMLTNRSPLMVVNMALSNDLFGLQQCHDNNSGLCDNCVTSSTSKPSRSGKHTNQYHPPHRYRYPPLQLQFPGTPQFYDYFSFNMTHNSLPPTPSSSQ